MRVKSILVICFFCLMALSGDCQVIRLVKSSVQDWSGGIAGHSGTNFNFTIEITGKVNDVELDTIYLKEAQFPIILEAPENRTSANTTLVKTKSELLYRISLQISHDAYLQAGIQDPPRSAHQPHRPIKGVAELLYRVRGQRRRFTVSKFMTQLPPANYP